MPFLRVIRDKRGYETTYLMHWYREGSRQRSRILYLFRTPGGVRVGRTALDPDVLRQIEQRYPDIEFDWTVVRENQQMVDATVDMRQRRERRPRRDDSESAFAPPPSSSSSTAPSATSSATASATQSWASPSVAPARPAPPPPPAPREQVVAEPPRSAEVASTPPTAEPAPAPPRPPIPAALEGGTPDEQIAFLARWYPIVRDRIPARTTNPERQEMLLALAERLNATAWTDADQITTGLQGAGDALERLSRVLARRRRRARKRPAPGAAADAAADDVADDGGAEG